MEFTLIKIITKNKAARNVYQVVNNAGVIMSERKSNRDYVAATIYGDFYFGRVDLVGKGAHGAALKTQGSETNKNLIVAYLKE